jgi:hypothetical protein
MPSDSVQMSSSSLSRAMQGVCLTVAALPILTLVLALILGLLVGGLLEEIYRRVRYGRWRGRRLPLKNISYISRQGY